MADVISIGAALGRRASTARAEAAAHQARMVELLRDAAECAVASIDERDVETARDALAALICDAPAPERVSDALAAWRGKQILSIALRLVEAEQDIRSVK